MRAKDWTMVVTSEPHLVFSLSPPIQFASQLPTFSSQKVHNRDLADALL